MTTEEVRSAHRQERRERRDRRHVDRAERREALLNAAIDGIRKHGPSASMDQLAAEAGVTKPILYRHFRGRSDLVAEIAKRFADLLLADLQAALGQQTPEPRTILTSTIDAFLAFIEREPALYRFLDRRDVDAADFTGFLDEISNRVAVVIGEQLRAAGRDSGSAEPVAHGVVAFVYAAGDWWIDRRLMPRPQLVTYLTDFLWEGFNGQGVQA